MILFIPSWVQVWQRRNGFGRALKSVVWGWGVVPFNNFFWVFSSINWPSQWSFSAIAKWLSIYLSVNKHQLKGCCLWAICLALKKLVHACSCLCQASLMFTQKVDQRSFGVMAGPNVKSFKNVSPTVLIWSESKFVVVVRWWGGTKGVQG